MKTWRVIGWVAGCLLALSAGAAEPDGLWSREEAAAGQEQETVYRLDGARLRSLLERAPLEDTEAAATPIEVAIPLADGTLARFAVVESPVLEPALAAKFPEIRTYSGTGIDVPGAITRFDLSPRGFHALVLGPGIQAFVEPVVPGQTHLYASRRTQNGVKEAPGCAVDTGGDGTFTSYSDVDTVDASSRLASSPSERRVYRLVAAATAQFTLANGGTVASAFAAITSTINGVNAIYERDLAIRLQLRAASTDVIYTDAASDPYTSGDLTCDATPEPCGDISLDCLLTENQCNVDMVVGSANYDISIVFDASNSGRAALQSVCDASEKGRGATGGTSVELAAHEIGHMFGGRHSFNGTTATCGMAGQRDGDRATEPASGSTIMSYAGTCDHENLQLSRSLDFNNRSFLDMLLFSTSGIGNTCPVRELTGNEPPVIESITSGPYTIPKETPFVLSVDAMDPDGDSLTYSWEQDDVGTASPPHADNGSRPLFRIYPPTGNSERFFPSWGYVLLNQNDPPIHYDCDTDVTCLVGETPPETTRTMHYNVMVRDNVDGVTVGSATVASDAGSGPFQVTSPNGGEFWTEGARRAVTWNVANTSQPPVSCTHVDIRHTWNGGVDYDTLVAGTPNDGSELVYVPFRPGTGNRVRIDCAGNIFFDISDATFTIEELAVRNANDSGRGSLRQAILDGNDYPAEAFVWIPFKMSGTGPYTLQLSTPLPTVQRNVYLDAREIVGPGYSGPPLFEIDGASCSGCDGLTLQGNSATVIGFAINRFGGNGVVVKGNSVGLALNYIGTNLSGTTPAGNFQSGIRLEGQNAGIYENVLSGNRVGVTITGASASGNVLQRNLIGTNAAGTARIPNDEDGVRIVNAPGNVIGGSSANEGNVISGNGRFNPSNAFVEIFADGIDISGASASGNIVQGNYIGLNAAGSAALDNTEHGVRINGAPNTLVGGTTAAARNVFADSLFINMYFSNAVHVQGPGATGTVIQGNYFGLDATGNGMLGIRGAGVFAEGPAVQIGGSDAGARNVFVNARAYGAIWLENLASGSQIRGNYIGTNAAGNVNLGTIVSGIRTYTGNNVIVGNVIAGSSHTGIDIRENGASGNTIQGNLIGLDAGGTLDFGNGTMGIQIIRSGNNLIGGTSAAARNVISGNNQFGIHIAGPPGPAGANLIQGNYIGTNAAGTAAVPNGIGVYIYETSDVTLGGAVPGAGNVISGNAAHGAEWFVSDPSAGLIAQGNLAGTNAAGTAALPNEADGFIVSVNGPITIQDNVLSGNARSGLEVCCRPTTGTIRGNRIGTDGTGALNIGNGWHGVDLGTGSVAVGGLTPGEGNVVAFNAGSSNYSGIRVGSGNGHRVRGNSIFSNFSLGVDLGGLGVQPNDACDTDTGPNGLQNYPVITSAMLSGPNTAIAGSLNSTASTSFDVDLYASPACDPSGFGEGAAYVGTATVTTDGSCSGTFTASIPGALSGSVTAIAVGPDGSSSEFSACLAVQPSAIAEVTGVAWAGKTELTWAPAAGATEYRVLRGAVADYGSLLDQALDSCERLLLPATATGPVLTEDPAAVAGRLYWYLVVGRNGIHEGPAGNASAGPRLANASGTCP